jgi:putative peptide zinc metalloprotease protein
MVARAVSAAAQQETPWTRMAPRRVRLRDTVQIARHRYRGRRWYLLRDTASGSWQRLNEAAFAVVRLLNGERSLATVHANLRSVGGDLDETELSNVINALHQAELLDWGGAQDAADLHHRARVLSQRKKLARWLSPLSMRLRLPDPDALLTRHVGLACLLFSRVGAMGAATLLLCGVLACVSAWPQMAGYWAVRGYAADAWLLMPLVYFVIKSVHEIAHGLAVKRWGGEVHDVGIVLMLLMPMPYVDASAAWGFARKRERIMVGAAGVLAELSLAAIAAVVFTLVEAGMIKDLAYTTLLIGSVSTLLFNGNPLLRYDGYYIFADAIEMPNLAPRASRYWLYLVQRYVLGSEQALSLEATTAERTWLLSYGAASCLYRLFVTSAVALLVASVVPALGLVLALWVLFGQVGWPLLRGCLFVAKAPQLHARRRRAAVAVVSSVIVILSVLLALPMPLATHCEGVVWLPSHGEVRAGAEGSLSAIPVTGAMRSVPAGTPFARIDSPLLNARIAVLSFDLEEMRSRRSAARIREPHELASLAQQIARLETDLAVLREEQANLVIKTPAAGRLEIPDGQNLAGRYVKKGQVVAYVLEPTAPLVRIAVPQSDAELLQRNIRAVQVRLRDAPARTVSATVREQVPSATRALPSPALGAAGGGLITVDPTDHKQAMENLFVLDLELTGLAPSTRVGGRALVRIEHDPEPVAGRLYRALRRLFLAHLAI